MGRVSILKIGQGDFSLGFDVLLQIREDKGSPLVELEGRLAANPELESLYICWQQLFQGLNHWDGERRSSPPSDDGDWQIEPGLVTNRATSEDVAACRQWVIATESMMETWLRSTEEASWQRIRERLNREFARYPDYNRLLIQARDTRLWKLPWHVWDLLNQYPNVGIGYSLPDFERRELSADILNPHPSVRILAVLGNSQNINLQQDRQTIEGLTQTEAVFLHQPRSHQLIQRLRARSGWDIFFFAGHSHSEQQTGRIYLNDHESLEIAQFKHALQEAIARGLKIAIFNSCEGLGLVQKLANLHIPAIIFMQEVVPDRVAQSFLREFLTEYGKEQALYTAVRRAQERLEEFAELPGATWLPIVYQNPAEVPPTWQDLLAQNTTPVQPVASSGLLSSQQQQSRFREIVLASLLITSAVLGLRWLGKLQSWELATFNHLMRQLPLETADPRLLIVGADEEDLRQYGHPFSDRLLAQLLERIQQHQPAAIGLDIVRDRPIPPGDRAFTSQISQLKKFSGICSFSTQLATSIAPPPLLKEQNIGFVDLYGDDDLTNGSDYTVRRYLLSRTANPISVPSRCSTPYSFGWQLIYRYLQAKGIAVKLQEDNWQFGSVVTRRLDRRSGGYHNLDSRGNQILIRYRNTANPQKIAQQVTFRDVLEGSNKFDPTWITGRVVLIGVTAPSIQDYHDSPYGKMRGLYIHAHTVSQILSALEDGRPLLWWRTEIEEGLWVLLWSFTGGSIVGLLSSPVQRGLGLGLGILVLYGGCWFALTQGGWVPLIPPAIALFGSAVTIIIGKKYAK